MFSSIFLMVIWILCTTPIQKSQTGRISKRSTVVLVNIYSSEPTDLFCALLRGNLLGEALSRRKKVTVLIATATSY